MANKELKSIKFEGLDDTYTLLTEEDVDSKLSEYAKTSELDKKLDANGLSTEEQSYWSSEQSQSSSEVTTKIKRNSKAILNLNTDNDINGYSRESGWHISPNVINSSTSFSETPANVYLKGNDGIIGVNTTDNVPSGEVSIGATFDGHGLHLDNGLQQAAATLDITRDSVKRNDKTETWENIIAAPSKIDSKQATLESGTNIKTINGESILGSGDIEVTPTIDSALSDSSENAVQNKVVKAAIDGKVDIITRSGLNCYGIYNGQQTPILMTANADSSSAMYRDSNGRSKVNAPVNDLDITNKSYVDTNLAKKYDKVDDITITSTGINIGGEPTGDNKVTTLSKTDWTIIDGQTIRIYGVDSITTPFGGDIYLDDLASLQSAISIDDSSSGVKACVETPTKDEHIANKAYVDSKSSTTTIVDNLTSTSTTSALSAYQGKVLKDAVDLKFNITQDKNGIKQDFSEIGKLKFEAGLTTTTFEMAPTSGRIVVGSTMSGVASKEATIVSIVDAANNIDNKYDLASGVGLNDYDVSVISENGDLMSDVYAGDISVTQVNGSSGLSGGIKIDNFVPVLYSGSKNETIENVIDSVNSNNINIEIAKDYNIVSTKNWMKTSSGGEAAGEAQYNKYYPLVYNQPVNEEVIKLAKIINAETNAVLATFTSVEELDSNTHTTAYHFGDSFTIIVVHEQDGDYTQLYDGRIPPYSWAHGFSYGVYLCGALLNTSGEYWDAENIPNTANLRIDFPTPLIAPKGSRTAIGGTYFTREKYIFYDDGRRECEILACAENVAITSSWGTLYEGSLGSFSFLAGFFTSEPEMSVEMCNTLNGEESGGIACFIETGVKPSTTSTGALYAVRPNGSATAKRIYFKIHAKQV